MGDVKVKAFTDSGLEDGDDESLEACVGVVVAVAEETMRKLRDAVFAACADAASALFGAA